MTKSTISAFIRCNELCSYSAVANVILCVSLPLRKSSLFDLSSVWFYSQDILVEVVLPSGVHWITFFVTSLTSFNLHPLHRPSKEKRFVHKPKIFKSLSPLTTSKASAKKNNERRSKLQNQCYECNRLRFFLSMWLELLVWWILCEFNSDDRI